MRTTRRPTAARTLALGAAILALALAGCSDTGSDGDAATPTAASTEPSTEPGETASGEAGSGEYAPVGSFPALSIAPMEADDAPATEVSAERLAEIAGGVAGVEPAEVTCEGTLRAGSSTPVTCTLDGLDGVVTAYPVRSGAPEEGDYSLVVDGELSPAQAEMAMDPEVTVHYGPTALFFDDPALLEQDGLVERVQGEFENLGLSDAVEVCEGIVGGGSGHSGVRCTGTQDGSPAPFEAQLYPTLSASGDPVTFALVHRPLQ